LIDEDGTSPWFAPSDRSSLAGLNANLHADLDAFRVMMAEQYASIVSSQVRQSIPNHLISNPSPLSSNLVTDPSGQSMLQTFAKYYDVIMVSGNCGEAPLVTQIYNLIHKPLMTGMIITAQQDSPEAGVATAFCNAPAQADRGANYVTNLTQFFNVTGADGVLPVVGTSWWEWTDKNVGGEHGNFGLVTNKDNAYNGMEDQIAPCTDAWGYKCGGEAANYGDFLVPVEGINKAADQALQNYFQTH